jgi:hypothetical protein
LAEASSTGISLERARALLPKPIGQLLQSGDILRTSGGTTAVVTFGPEKTRFILGPGTELQLIGVSRGKHFHLALGKLEATVVHQRPFKPMIIDTPQAVARVLGTKFTLSLTTNATRLEVTEGEVRLIRLSDDKPVQVPAGEYTVAAVNYELNAQPLTGSILREYWTNLIGDYYVMILKSNPNFPDHPSGRDYLDKFEAPNHWAQDYGARFRGYLHPPLTGDYTFWVAAGDGAELYLSPDETPQNKRQIGYADSTSPHQWTNDRSQQSSAITLVAGKKYYIEVLQKQGKGDDHLAVAWRGPGRDRAVIPGEFLSPFKPERKEETK